MVELAWAGVPGERIPFPGAVVSDSAERRLPVVGVRLLKIGPKQMVR